MTFILDAEQERDAQRIAAEKSLAAADISTMSSGKTYVALRVAQIRNAETVLVIAPLQTRLGWKLAAERLGINLPFHWIRNHKDGETAKTLLQFGEPGIYFIGPEYATQLNWVKMRNENGDYIKNEKNQIIKKRSPFWDSVNPDIAVVDEVHRGVGDTKSQRHKFYAKMQAGFKLALSGTPYGNSFEGAYGLAKFLWPDIMGPFGEWKKKWCATEFDNWAFDKMKVTGEKNPGAFFSWLPCVVRREWKYEGHVDSQEIFVELGATQRKAYNELQRNLVTWIENQPFVIEFPPTLRIRLREASLGMFSVGEDGDVMFKHDCQSSKLDVAKMILAGDFEGEPALIFTASKKFAKVAVERLKKWGFSAEEWSGDISQTRREEAKARFISGETRYLVAVVKAAGTGTDGLQDAARNMLILSRDDSRIENEQGLARVIRRGQGDLVRVREIIALDTYDQGVLDKQVQGALEMNKSLKLEEQK